MKKAHIITWLLSAPSALAKRMLKTQYPQRFRSPLCSTSPTREIPNLLHGQELIGIESKELQEIATVSFYLNDQLIARDDKAPFEAVLSSEDFADGKHQLKVTATADGQREGAREQEVVISNTLFNKYGIEKKWPISLQDVTTTDYVKLTGYQDFQNTMIESSLYQDEDFDLTGSSTHFSSYPTQTDEARGKKGTDSRSGAGCYTPFK